MSVSNGSETASDDVTVTVIADSLSIAEASTRSINNQVLAAKENGEVITYQKKTSSDGDYLVLNLGDDYSAITVGTHVQALYIGDQILLADPAYDNQRGIVALINKSQLTDKEINLNEDLDFVPGVTSAQGASAGDGFGYVVALGDVNADGYEEISVLAPGTTHGTVYVLDVVTLDVLHLVVGSTEELLKSPFLATLDLNGTSGTETLVGVTSSANASLNLASSNSIAIAESTASFNGLVARTDFPTVVNFSDQDPDFILDTESLVTDLAQGDVNGDGQADVVVAARDSGLFMISFGNSEIGESDMFLDEANAIISGESSDYSSLAVGDVSGDGIDDIIMGYAEAGSGRGAVHVHLGTPVWLDSDYDADQEIVIEGESDNAMGQWLRIADEDEDGVSEIYTNKGQNNSIVLSLFNSSSTTGSSGNGLGPGGSSCSLVFAEVESSNPFLTLLLSMLSLFSLLALRLVKK